MADEQTGTRRRQTRRVRIALWALGVPINLFLLAALLWLSFPGGPITLPGWATARIEAALNAGLEAQVVRVGRAEIRIDAERVPRVRLFDVRLRDAGGASLGQITALGARLSIPALLGGEVRPDTLSLAGAQITLRRDRRGALALGFGAGARTAGPPSAVLGTVAAAFSAPPLDGIARMTAEDVTVTLEDARSGRRWQATGGRLALVNGAEAVAIDLVADVFNGTEELAGVQISLTAEKSGGVATLAATVRDVPARDVALQSPALAFLGVLDAPVSGSVRTILGATGEIERFDAALEIGAGAVRPEPEARPVRFDAANAYLSYDPDRARLNFSELSVRGDWLTMQASGHAYLRDFDGPWPATVLAQLRIDRLTAAPEGMFESQVALTDGRADLRLRLDPFAVELGQLAIAHGDTRLGVTGRAAAGSDGWRVAADLTVDRLDPDELTALWPVALAPMTRGWIARNVAAGTVTDVTGALRLTPGERRRLGLSFAFDGGEVTALRHLPPLRATRGHAALSHDAFTVTLEAGEIGGVDVAGSSFRIRDVAEKPGRAVLRLETSGPLPALLTVLDHPPFEVLKKAGRSADIATAWAEGRTEARFALTPPGVTPDVRFTTEGRLTDLRSETLVPGRVLAAEELSVTATERRIEIAGRATLDTVPVSATWSRPLGEGGPHASRVVGTVTISPETLAALGIHLPEGLLTGAGEGQLALDLVPDRPPAFTLSSDLAGLRLAIPALGWVSPAGETGRLELAGRLGDAPAVDRILLDAPGLAAEGRIALSADGAFQEAVFETVRAGNWLDTAVTLTARDPGQPPAVRLDGGRADLRYRPAHAGGGPTVPVEARLDRLVLTEGIAAQPFRGSFRAGAGLDGSFTARINGGATVEGILVPDRGRTAVRISGSDAGRVLRDAGLFKSLEDGAFELNMRPRAEGPGFVGQATVRTARLRNQPVIVDLLDAISIAGILDQLRGPGILFDRIDARFRLLPDRLILDETAAVGASIGISLDGVYDIGAKRLDMGGVISPVYFLNAVGRIFTRRGEGLFGFTYRVRGDAADPRVTVNPLSILTPGFFREIFRQRPPGQ